MQHYQWFMLEDHGYIALDHFFMGRYLSEYSMSIILPYYVDLKCDQLFQNGGCFCRYPGNPELSKSLDLIEEKEQAWVLEIVVGRGNNDPNRPILKYTRDFLMNHRHCKVFVECETVVFAYFDMLSILEEQNLKYNKNQQPIRPPIILKAEPVPS
jgi:hypothetical protein